jgi:hypothetical protein
MREGSAAEFHSGTWELEVVSPLPPWFCVDISNERSCERRFWRSIKGKVLLTQDGEICDSEGVRGGEKWAGRDGEEMRGWSGGVTSEDSI